MDTLLVDRTSVVNFVNNLLYTSEPYARYVSTCPTASTSTCQENPLDRVPSGAIHNIATTEQLFTKMCTGTRALGDALS